MKHSPAPWKFESGECRTINDASGESLMGDECYYPWAPTEDADWHLIAAAPDLLSELENCADLLRVCFPNAPVGSCIGVAIIKAEAAIAKATREQK